MTNDTKTTANSSTTSNLMEREVIEKEVSNVLDRSVEQLTPEVRRGLNAARNNALQQRNKKDWWYSLKPAASVAVVVVLVSLSLQWPSSGEHEMVTSVEPFADVFEEDLDMLEDLELVYWIAESEGGEI